MEYIAHFNDKNEIQTIKEHSENVATLAESFSIDLLKPVAKISGLYHDIGKYGEEWQNHIVSGKGKVLHAIYGALEINKLQNANNKLNGPLSRMAQYIITGHHSGIPNGGSDIEEGTLQFQMINAPKINYNAYKDDIQAEPIIEEPDYIKHLIENNASNLDGIVDNYAFDVRMGHSYVTDADSLDTKSFCCSLPAREPLKYDFVSALQSIEKYISKFPQDTEVRKARTRLQNQVYENIKKPAEINLMNLPTGAGKTICSVKAGIELLLKYKKKRIIYIIPYNCISDQTAKEFENIFGNHVSILRHQSTYNLTEEETNEETLTSKLDALENWDTPFIITTSAQFFESAYGDKRKKTRKLHNMEDSILIFDEIHKLPDELLQACLEIVSYLTKDHHSIALLLSATMPNMEELIHKLALPTSTIKDLVPDKTDFCWFSKCQYKKLPRQKRDELILDMSKNVSALMVVNRKKTAREIYNELCLHTKCKVYHLSTYQTPEDRLEIILEIKEYLKDLSLKYSNLNNVPEEERIMVVSTSLIEAGVDLDFETVYRELTGLDSILQTGGRCNREGLQSLGMVYVFTLEETKETIGGNITKQLLKTESDISTSQSIKTYFERYYSAIGDIVTKYSIHNFVLKKCRNFYDYIPFRTYTNDIFQFINNVYGESIVIPKDEKSETLIKDILENNIIKISALQKYTVQVSKSELDYLIALEVVEDNNTGVWCLTDKTYYSKETGIKTV